MGKLETSNFRLGIIAGGQLAKMLIHEASKWGIDSYVLDQDSECPAAGVATRFVQGSHLDYDAVYEFGKQVDLLTYELENISIEALKKLKAEGQHISPDPTILELIQDKGLQKEFYQKNNLPISKFKTFSNKEDVLTALDEGQTALPFVQKLRKGGYDGRGVAVINDLNDLGKLLPGASIVEEKVAIAKEISVIVARNAKGETKCFPVVEMVFDPKANLVDKLVCPASIAPQQSEEALKLAGQIIDMLGMVGILAIEFFIDVEGRVVINEMAPRTHNSGHHTIEGIVTSQFEQHLRAILNLPLGSTAIKMPAVMVNILGAEGMEGPVVYEGLAECLAIEGVKVHLYGKKTVKPFRKMGHITVLSPKLEDAIYKAERVKKLVRAGSWGKH